MKQALEMALEALSKVGYVPDAVNPHPIFVAITAIKEALAQPEQEPLNINHKHEWFRTGEMKVGQMRCISCGTWGQEEMPQRTEQEPVAWLTEERYAQLHTAHRKRLTDEEMKKIWYDMKSIMGWYSFQEIARAIEAAHGIKE